MKEIKNIPASLTSLIDRVKDTFPNDEKLQNMFEQCFLNTYETTLKPQEDGTTFVITGDIPAMWLRDSAAQVRPYLMAAETDEEIADLIEGVVRRQIRYINEDPYANAFNEGPNGKGHQSDKTDMTPSTWERKYEIDSLCYPLQLSYLFWKSTGRTEHFNDDFIQALKSIIHVWKTEQEHEEKSTYRFERENVRQSDTLIREGKGSETVRTGMTWSAFRPSDDACLYGYLVPANMFAAVVLDYAAEICESALENEELKKQCEQLASEIRMGIENYALLNHPVHQEMYVYETDGKGGYHLMDDANVPSLLAMPYLGWCDFDDQRYINTRQFLLSRDNPYYYEGKAASGIGSPHTPDHYIWHISLAIQGMTCIEDIERKQILEVMKASDGGTGFMHEGFNSDDPSEFTRDWFSWANSMFSEFVLSLCGLAVKDSPLYKKIHR
ncbi:glycoside hydrolase family 125 protein [Rossellomorea sp. BNER]|uniref:glycoside hydrolase family 125 protein n=1 Tax=Rossellomorea sp. BNER TaxID=2962031 RepID=UPI003AF25D91|nr:glycoside hydrolase family 125 protein [Rossellomorea sp. BNER]